MDKQINDVFKVGKLKIIHPLVAQVLCGDFIGDF